MQWGNSHKKSILIITILSSAQCEWVHIYLCGIMGNERDIGRGRGIESGREREW